jgi:hypothetical protein
LAFSETITALSVVPFFSLMVFLPVPVVRASTAVGVSGGVEGRAAAGLSRPVAFSDESVSLMAFPSIETIKLLSTFSSVPPRSIT